MTGPMGVTVGVTGKSVAPEPGSVLLSDTKIRKAAKAERDYKLSDEKGLFLLLRKNGGKL